MGYWFGFLGAIFRPGAQWANFTFDGQKPEAESFTRKNLENKWGLGFLVHLTSSSRLSFGLMVIEGLE